MDACLTESEIEALARDPRPEGQSTPSRATQVTEAVPVAHAHLEACDLCRSRVAARRNGDTPPGEPLVAGATAGRFVVLRRIGAGGMGAVYSAYDPDLDRKVALKVVLPGRWGARPQARLMREAQAMARLSHPEVITVYEVDLVDNQVFIAMEFMDGGTLREWLESEPRPWREIVERYIRAGEGLAAAHAAGIVHRDFKADNVLLGSSGRQRVTDFGLARSIDDNEPEMVHEESSLALSEQITRPGDFLGTPAFMAPEQIRGDAVDARADQFGFCASLYEALYGELPFQGGRGTSYPAAVLAGDVRPPRAGARIPSRVRAALVRGLRARAEGRFPSMDELLAELRAPLRRSRGLALVVGAVALSLAGVAVGEVASHRPPVCAGAARKLSGVWDAPARQALRQAFTAAGPGGAESATRVERVLDQYAASWIHVRTDACEATRVRGEQSENLFDRRMACLDRRLFEMKATVDALSRSTDREAVSRAIDAASQLTRLDACSDARALEALVPPPEDPRVAAQVAEIDRSIAASLAEYHVAHFAVALDGLERAAGADVPYLPVQAQALYQQMRVEEEQGDYRKAEETGKRALPIAAAARDDLLVSRLWSLLVYDVGYDLRRSGDALAMLVAGEAAVERTGHAPEAEADWLSNRASFMSTLGRDDEAQRLFERTLAIDEKVDAPDVARSRWIASDMANLAVAEHSLGHLERAIDLSKRAIAMREDVYGPDHPRLADPMNNLGNTLCDVGRYDEARSFLQRAYDIDERSIGTENIRVARILGNLARVAEAQGDLAEAQRLLERDIAIREKVMGHDHRDSRFSIASLAAVLRKQGRLADARAAAERAVAIGETIAASRPDGPVPGLSALGRIAHDQGKETEAIAVAQRAVGIEEAQASADKSALLEPLTTLALALARSGHATEAKAAAERALAITESTPLPPLDRAEVRLWAGEALYGSVETRARAIGLVEQARDASGAAGHGGRALFDAAQTWLQTVAP
jgi:serine/threonine-protein kinase